MGGFALRLATILTVLLAVATALTTWELAMNDDALIAGTFDPATGKRLSYLDGRPLDLSAAEGKRPDETLHPAGNRRGLTFAAAELITGADILGVGRTADTPPIQSIDPIADMRALCLRQGKELSQLRSDYHTLSKECRRWEETAGRESERAENLTNDKAVQAAHIHAMQGVIAERDAELRALRQQTNGIVVPSGAGFTADDVRRGLIAGGQGHSDEDIEQRGGAVAWGIVFAIIGAVVFVSVMWWRS